MIVEDITIKALRIREAAHLDPIHVLMWDAAPGNGSLTITCFDRSWSCYWGAMGDGNTVEKFLSSVSTGYLVDCLVRANRSIITNLKTQTQDSRYLTRIVDVVKEVIAVRQ